MKSYNYTKELRKKENDRTDTPSSNEGEKNVKKDKNLESDNECKDSEDDECKEFIKSVIGPMRSSSAIRREDDYIYSQNQAKQTNKQTNKRPLLGNKSKWFKFLALSDDALTKHGSFLATEGLGMEKRRRTDELGEGMENLNGGYVTTRSQRKKEQQQPQQQ